jgi:hypothetical protein
VRTCPCVEGGALYQPRHMEYRPGHVVDEKGVLMEF